jgi:hypothetical protein
MRIYRLTDTLEFKIGEITIKVSPLSQKQKADVNAEMIKLQSEDINIKVGYRGLYLCIKYALKGISGLETMDGKEYKLDFEDGVLTDQCVDELLNLDISPEIAAVCTQFMRKVSEKITDAEGNELKGIEFINPRQGG